ETTPSAPPIVPPASNAPTESQETQVQLKKSVVIVISLSVAAVFLLFIFIWYRRKMGPSWYKFGGTWEWDWAAWRKERERNRALVNKRRRRGSIQTFMGPPPEYETRLAWDFPAPAAPA